MRPEGRPFFTVQSQMGIGQVEDIPGLKRQIESIRISFLRDVLEALVATRDAGKAGTLSAQYGSVNPGRSDVLPDLRDMVRCGHAGPLFVRLEVEFDHQQVGCSRKVGDAPGDAAHSSPGRV